MHEHEHFMARALRCAEQGMFTAHPNPRVGAVVVRDGRIIGEGYHLRTGGPHAEVEALTSVSGDVSGTSVYCTMEPCSFEGRTPSCAQMLIDRGIKQLIYGMEDPHPKNRGLGFSMLRTAGVEVMGPVLEASARQLNPGHIKRYETGMPYVRLKLAASLDGRTALASGESQWITGDEARRDVQALRARSGAILTGVGTVNADNPSLMVRAEQLDSPHGVISADVSRSIAVVDSAGSLNRTSALCQNPSLIHYCGVPARIASHGQSVVAPLSGRRIDLSWVLSDLASRDCHEVLAECGPTLAGALIDGNLVDELVLYVAPKLIGQDGRPLLHLGKIDSMQTVAQWTTADVRQVGQDLRVTLRPPNGH